MVFETFSVSLAKYMKKFTLNFRTFYKILKILLYINFKKQGFYNSIFIPKMFKYF